MRANFKKNMGSLGESMIINGKLGSVGEVWWYLVTELENMGLLVSTVRAHAIVKNIRGLMCDNDATLASTILCI